MPDARGIKKRMLFSRILLLYPLVIAFASLFKGPFAYMLILGSHTGLTIYADFSPMWFDDNYLSNLFPKNS